MTQVNLHEPQHCQILMYGADGALIRAGESEDVSPEQLAHMSLHSDGVVCVQISVLNPDGAPEWLPVIQRCDPGLDFGTVVGNGPLG
jgi:hypothetical protein